MPEEEKIKILLAEYTGLRSEIVARTGHGFQVSGFAVTALSLLASQSVNWRTILVFVFIMLFLTGAGILTIRDAWRAVARTRQIEEDVNKRAGENLLVWETLWGSAPRNSFFNKPPQSN
jgi:hypothetical protein